MPRIFDRYWQGRPTAATGAGLGLYIAKGIVEAHGGSICATSAPGQGTTVAFTVPLASGPGPAVVVGAAALVVIALTAIGSWLLRRADRRAADIRRILGPHQFGSSDPATWTAGLLGAAKDPKQLFDAASYADAVPKLLPSVLEEDQALLLRQSRERREARTSDVRTVEEAVEAAAAGGWARIPWADLGPEGEERLAAEAVSVRCLVAEDGSVPGSDDEPGTVAVVGRAY